ncbi:DJ-1/PfpI family protein [Virgibacillus soli]|uniref:DJ-1/PfpI family protein n=1 Tax=Paracerasibacillus soli TaxID=480284 RepID=UPI0035E47427
MKKVLFFVYDEYADFQIGHLLFFLKKLGKMKVDVASLHGKEVVSLGGLKVCAANRLQEAKMDEYDLFLIPGGDGVHSLLKQKILHDKLLEAYEKNILIAAMCGSVICLAEAELLNQKAFTCNELTFNQFQDIFIQGNYTGKSIETSTSGIITAKGTAFALFTIAVLENLKLLQNDNQREHIRAFCKGEA